MMSLVQIST